MSDRTQDETSRAAEETAASMHRIWLAGLGALQQAESEGRELFRRLVERGEEFAARSRPTVDRLRERTLGLTAELREEAEKGWERLERLLDEKLSAAMTRLGVPGRDELRDLSERVEALSRKIETLAESRVQRRTSAPKKKAAKRGAKRATRKTVKKTAAKKTPAKKRTARKKTTAKSAAKGGSRKPAPRTRSKVGRRTG